MSPMMASASDIRPPAPMPWRARNPASMYIEVASPQRAEPTMNTTMANMNSVLRP